MSRSFRYQERPFWDIDLQEELLREVLFCVLEEDHASRLASQLMRRFGSLPEILSKSVYRLREVHDFDDIVLPVLRVVKDAVISTTRARIDFSRAILPAQEHLLRDYLHVTMAFEEIELFRVFFLDTWGRLISDEVLQKGTVAHTPVFPREVVRRALDLSARSIILVHNHPSGDPAPSSADVSQTLSLIAAAHAFDIRVEDHIVVAKAGDMSLLRLGLLHPY